MKNKSEDLIQKKKETKINSIGKYLRNIFIKPVSPNPVTLLIINADRNKQEHSQSNNVELISSEQI